jgi:hypothetical protein
MGRAERDIQYGGVCSTNGFIYALNGEIKSGCIGSMRGSYCALGSALVRRVKVPLVLG